MNATVRHGANSDGLPEWGKAPLHSEMGSKMRDCTIDAGVLLMQSL